MAPSAPIGTERIPHLLQYQLLNPLISDEWVMTWSNKSSLCVYERAQDYDVGNKEKLKQKYVYVEVTFNVTSVAAMGF